MLLNNFEIQKRGHFSSEKKPPNPLGLSSDRVNIQIKETLFYVYICKVSQFSYLWDSLTCGASLSNTFLWHMCYNTSSQGSMTLHPTQCSNFEYLISYLCVTFWVDQIRISNFENRTTGSKVSHFIILLQIYTSWWPMGASVTT